MAEDGNPAVPASLTLMAGPIDTRINPTAINRFATSRPIQWFALNTIGIVPCAFRTAPGARLSRILAALQLYEPQPRTARQKLGGRLHDHLSRGEAEKAAGSKTSMTNISLSWICRRNSTCKPSMSIFQQHRLPRGKLFWHGHRIAPRAITRTALLTIEGERDDICAVGQTLAAQESLQRSRALHEKSSGADRSRSLWRVQRPSLGQRGVSGRARHHSRND